MTDRRNESALAESMRKEQEYVTNIYRLLDAARRRSEEALKEAHAQGAAGTFAARIEREVSAAEHARRLAQLESAERNLCFGRIDDTAGATFYIGRIGLHDGEYNPVLIDWRAPAARLFYTATPKDPGNLLRRRHLYTRGRNVVGVDDEVFDLTRMTETDRRELAGEAMLLASVRRGRTGRMSDAVATIQAEQDRVIRSAMAGALVIQGGPGTGKTVAALHRAAFLLYTHRRALERRGVLIIGPNLAFLRYISQVLPSLGETDVVLSSPGELFPGIHATGEDSPEAALVKGDVRMVKVLAAAIRSRQRIPDAGLDVVAGDVTLHLPSEVCAHARSRARALHQPHNKARKLFVTQMLDALAREDAAMRGIPRDECDGDLAETRAHLWDEAGVRKALDELWPLLTPQQLLTGLFGDENELRDTAAPLTEAERKALFRPPRDGWTVADVPLLDEAAELLGTDNSSERALRRAEERQRQHEEAYAEGVLELTGLAGQGAVDAATLAERNRDTGPYLTVAERASADRTWAYGHVIVDEAQELSAMAWRMIMRRIPAKSMTIVGDVAQTGSPAGARSWKEMLDPHVKGRWRIERLTVNYRTPAEIMAVAADVLDAAAPGEAPPRSVRAEGQHPRAVRVSRDGFAAGVARVAGDELAQLTASGEGRLAVIAPAQRLPDLSAAMPHAAPGDRAEALDSQVALYTVTQAKGLEFDRVVLADPSGIIAASPMGGHDLYVAITRATHRLTVVYEADLPRCLSGLPR